MPESKGKTTEETNDKQLFQEGGKPGPGRGHKKPHKIDDLDFWQATEEMIREIMKSSDESNRLKGVSLYLKWQSLRTKSGAESQAGDVVDPGIMSMLGDAVERLLHGDLPEFDEEEDLDDE